MIFGGGLRIRSLGGKRKRKGRLNNRANGGGGGKELIPHLNLAGRVIHP